MNDKIYDIANYLAKADYIFLAKCEVYDPDEHKFEYLRKIFPANSFAEAAIMAEAECGDELNSLTLECLDTCFTFDEETYEKFRQGKMPIFERN